MGLIRVPILFSLSSNSKMLSLKKWLKTELRIYRNPLEPNQGDLRLFKILSYNIKIHYFVKIFDFLFILLHKLFILFLYNN